MVVWEPLKKSWACCVRVPLRLRNSVINIVSDILGSHACVSMLAVKVVMS